MKGVGDVKYSIILTSDTEKHKTSFKEILINLDLTWQLKIFITSYYRKLRQPKSQKRKEPFRSKIFTQLAIDLLAEAGETENTRICFDRKEDRLGRTMHKLKWICPIRKLWNTGFIYHSI